LYTPIIIQTLFINEFGFFFLVMKSCFRQFTKHLKIIIKKFKKFKKEKEKKA